MLLSAVLYASYTVAIRKSLTDDDHVRSAMLACAAGLGGGTGREDWGGGCPDVWQVGMLGTVVCCLVGQVPSQSWLWELAAYKSCVR